MRACGGGNAYHYSPVVQTNSGMGCKPVVKWVQTNSGTATYHYSFVVQTYSGSRVDLYRLLLPPHGGGGGTSGGGGCLALWAYLRL